MYRGATNEQYRLSRALSTRVPLFLIRYIISAAVSSYTYRLRVLSCNEENTRSFHKRLRGDSVAAYFSKRLYCYSKMATDVLFCFRSLYSYNSFVCLLQFVENQENGRLQTVYITHMFGPVLFLFILSSLPSRVLRDTNMSPLRRHSCPTRMWTGLKVRKF